MTGKADMAERRVHAFGDDVLGEEDAVGLAERIRRGEISPREAAEAAIRRIEDVEPELRGVELAAFEQALEQIPEQLGEGIFAGVPSLIKDNTDVRGWPTRHGSAAVVNPRPAKDHGAFAKQYLAQGFTVLGKSRLPEFGFSASSEFEDESPTRNPWHTEHSSGASSGGAAALVAAGALPIAHANDGGGSIRIPAACCGLVGLKPSRGRFVDSEMTRSLPVNVVGEGVVTRSVRDTAAFFHGAEQYHRNRRLPPVGRVEGPGSKRLRVGLVLDSINGHPTCEETRDTALETARLLESLGHRVEEIKAPVPPTFRDDFLLYWGFLSWSLSTFGRRMLSPDFDPDRVDGLSKGLRAHYRKKGWRTPQMLYRFRQVRRQYEEHFRHQDVVLSPALSHVTPRLGWLNPSVPFEELIERLTAWVGFTPINNVSGTPAISLPMGESREGLPIGVQFSGAPAGERTLLELAFELEQARPWRRIQDVTPVKQEAVIA